MRPTGAEHTFEPEIASLGAAGVLAAVDVGLLLADWPAGGPLLAAVAVCFFLGLLAALLWRLVRAAVRWLGSGRRAGSLVAGLLALWPVIHISFRLFEGTGIRARWYAPYGPYLVVPVLLGLTVIAVAVLRWILPRARGGCAGRLSLAGLLLLGASLSGLLDRRLYPNQYAYLHAVLLLLTATFLLGAVWLLLPAGRPGRVRWMAPALLLLSVPAVLLASLFAVGGQGEMQKLAERTHLGGRIAALARNLLDLDGDHCSIIFGERDCNNRERAVHPFAIDLPGNGVDEDCDGRDALPPPPAPPRRAPGVREYRSLLRSLRQDPPARELLRRAAGFNVLLVVLDGLRADQVKATPENLQNHPHLLRLLGESRRFVRAFSTGAGTDIGMSTIFTAQLDPFDRRHRSLFHRYREAGFRTHGVFQREVERWVGRQFSIDGLDGRKVVVNDPGRRDVGSRATSPQVTDEGIRFLRQMTEGPERFFLWLHYFDIHEHHQIDLKRLPDPEGYRAERGRPSYRSMIRFVDGELHRLLLALQETGLAERTVLALAGDHGEGLAESQRLPANHGDVLYGQLVHVPMALRVPGVEPGEVRLAVSLADLYPTLADLSGLPAFEAYGLSLLPYLLDADPPRLGGFVRPVVMYETRQKALLVWPWKLILWQDSGRAELYNLDRDFAEERNLADEQPERTRALARQLLSYPLITVDRLKPRR